MMSPDVLKILAAILAGAAVLALAWGGRSILYRRFEADRDWIHHNALRFSPTPIDARQWAMWYYGTYGLLLLGLLLLVPSALLALLIWAALLPIPRVLVNWLWQRRRASVDLQLPPAIAAMANSMRAGLTLVQAIQRLADSAPEPIRTEFRIMASRYAFGVNLEGTVLEAKQRLRLPNFNIFASALLLNREMGGDVSETLTRISQSLDKLQQMRKTVEAHTSEGRTNIKVLLAAPVLLLLMLSSADPEGVKAMFTTPQGYGLLAIVVALQAAGIYIASRITKQEI